ncbi:unnamed protein product [Bursaphelenchus okinawaensis]|uniref:Uncharacterized protein n=1 Tax=Bursaphelenchus okinawaensis TaxID=465554 RepID=A0A811K3X3_9BILA|nr:unnamed protein product [Bursaphelenchus okinawaensis]CAG9090127.1 unnamed protein product [Bursaphelenchus okinawaensis]
MGCNSSSFNKALSFFGCNTRKEYDFSHINIIEIIISSSTTYITLNFIDDDGKRPYMILDRYEMILAKLLQCFEKKRHFIVSLDLSDECLWSLPLLRTVANFLLEHLSSASVCVKLRHSTPVDEYALFIDFYKKVHPIVDVLQVSHPTMLRYLMDIEIKVLVLEPCPDDCWLALKYLQVSEVRLFYPWDLENYVRNGIRMPTVETVILCYEKEMKKVNMKKFHGNFAKVFPTLERFTIKADEPLEKPYK